MEIYQLRTFVTVAREGNLTRAAELLFLSQPAVSAHVRALEEELGVALFERTPKGMKLTAGGEALLGEAEAVLAAHKGLIDRAAGLKGCVSGRLRIGVASSAETLKLGELLARLAARHPGLQLQLRQGSSGSILDELRSGRLDAGYVLGDGVDGAFSSVRLRRLSIFVAAPVAWRERIESAGWDKILALPWIGSAPQSFCGQVRERIFRENGIRPVRTAEADHERTTRSLVAAGVGVALMHEEIALEAQRAGEVVLWNGARWHADLMFVYPRDRDRDPALAALVPIVREVWAA